MLAADLRQHDLVAHDNRGESLVLLAEVDRARAPDMITRLLSIVWSFGPSQDSTPTPVAVGHATYPADAESAQALLDKVRSHQSLHERARVQVV